MNRSLFDFVLLIKLLQGGGSSSGVPEVSSIENVGIDGIGYCLVRFFDTDGLNLLATEWVKKGEDCEYGIDDVWAITANSGVIAVDVTKDIQHNIDLFRARWKVSYWNKFGTSVLYEEYVIDGEDAVWGSGKEWAAIPEGEDVSGILENISTNLNVYASSNVYVLDYIRTNYSDLSFTLDWVYRRTDTFELVYKMARTPLQTGQWPSLIGTTIATNAVLYIQWNLYSNRRVMNIAYDGQWSGDGVVSYDSPFDYTNYYRLVVNGGSFNLYKGTTLNNINTLAFSYSKTNGVGTDTLPVMLFPLNGAMRTDLEFYRLSVVRNGAVIHNYLPIEDGIIDMVSGTEFAASSTGHINGQISSGWRCVYYYSFDGLTLLHIEFVPYGSNATWGAGKEWSDSAGGTAVIGILEDITADISVYRVVPESYLPNSNADYIICEAFDDNFDASALAWGTGNNPVQFNSSGATRQDDAVLIPVKSSGTLAYVDLSENSTQFTAYIVCKLVNPSAYSRILSAMAARSAGQGILLYGSTVAVSSWANDTSTGVSSSAAYFAAAMKFGDSSNSGGLVNNGNYISKPPSVANRYLTLARTDIDPSASNAEPCDILVKYLGVVKEAETEATIRANMQYLMNEFGIGGGS